MNSILIIQTAFLGDVILATSLAESLHKKFPDSKIDFLVQKGNESLFENHPFLREILVFDKKKNKLFNLFRLAAKVREKKYDLLVNVHRFGSSGFITLLSAAKDRRGFEKNPFSFSFTKKFKHEISANGRLHEIERNHALISDLTDSVPAKPKLYPSLKDFEKAKSFFCPNTDNRSPITDYPPFLCIAPASVWFTKQFPKEKWMELIKRLPENQNIFLLGGKNDFELCEEISLNSQISNLKSQFSNLKSQISNLKSVVNLAGKLSLPETAALMKSATMNFVNDSAPLHIASAMNAPVTAIFCSTVPAFGFGPLSDNSKIIETGETLSCRPCGLHGYKTCPEGHFKCGRGIKVEGIL